MKTSLELSANLFNKAKKVAQQRNTSLKALIEEGLRLLLERHESRKSIKPKVITFGKDGLTEEYVGRGLDWNSIREEIYRGHGA
jgi:hypothetical protein